MRTRAGLVTVALSALVASGCGSNLKANYAKYDATKKVAIVGVCQLEDNPVARGTNSTRVNVGSDLVDALAKGFDQALPNAWSGVQVIPLQQVSTNTALPRREVFKRRRCAGGMDPFLPKGYTGDADRAYMSSLAKQLGVDAVIAISSDIGLRFSGETVRFMAGSFNPVYVHVVDKDGEQIVWVSMKGLDSAEVPVTKDAHQAAGMSYGQVVAKEFVQRMANR
ncbi:MAG: hypothetical protein JNL79_36960 [Myxococcales bacterium]|nr:hypothetical protein [Myxococcales bacterium]